MIELATAHGRSHAAPDAFAGPPARVWAATLGRGLRESTHADIDRLVALVEA